MENVADLGTNRSGQYKHNRPHFRRNKIYLNLSIAFTIGTIFIIAVLLHQLQTQRAQLKLTRQHLNQVHQKLDSVTFEANYWMDKYKEERKEETKL